MKYYTNSSTETKRIAQKLSQNYLIAGGIIALSGEVGAGKTTFSQGFAKGLGISKRLVSPTFILIKSYKIPKREKGRLFHIDLYHLSSPDQISQIGLSEIFSNHSNIVLLEWAQKLGLKLPLKTKKIKIKIISDTKREIDIKD